MTKDELATIRKFLAYFVTPLLWIVVIVEFIRGLEDRSHMTIAIILFFPVLFVTFGVAGYLLKRFKDPGGFDE